LLQGNSIQIAELSLIQQCYTNASSKHSLTQYSLSISNDRGDNIIINNGGLPQNTGSINTRAWNESTVGIGFSKGFQQVQGKFCWQALAIAHTTFLLPNKYYYGHRFIDRLGTLKDSTMDVQQNPLSYKFVLGATLVAKYALSKRLALGLALNYSQVLHLNSGDIQVEYTDYLAPQYSTNYIRRVDKRWYLYSTFTPSLQLSYALSAYK
jgi:hypothetical protein